MTDDFRRILPDGSIYFDAGPMQLRIHVRQGDGPATHLALAGAEKAYSLLEELSKHKEIITGFVCAVHPQPEYPAVVVRMIESVRKTGDPSLTPLAAVAGTVADEVADFVWALEKVDKVVINNGGDIALRLRRGASAKIGLQENLSVGRYSNVLIAEHFHGIEGVATSGLGGRSLTKGIASAVTSVASTASMADAAATIIANAVDVDSPCIVRTQAEEIDPGTDIPGQSVTIRVGRLNRLEIEEALEAGMAAADKLRRRGCIMGAVLSLQGTTIVCPTLRSMVRPVSEQSLPPIAEP
jgi:ApbE superfamily uncharacterized protein (UPF0280 family)